MDDDVQEAVKVLREDVKTVGADAALMILEDELAELDAAHARVAALVSVGQYLADVLRAGSTGNHTASLLGALDRWEAARNAGRDGEAHPPGPRARPPQRNTDSGAVGG